jgi:NAD(P)-dependent dehydrogenase (short-subunit alcohol dehydrogenase family)
MPTIAIVGAGPGLGLSIAKIFGGHGFEVALISRSKDNLDGLLAQLAKAGIRAAAFPADVTDRPSLTAALEAAATYFGAIDVLEYSAHSGLNRLSPAEVTVENLQSQIEHLLYGAVAATQAVLPAMRKAGRGTLIYTMGGGAINPYPMLAAMNASQAALRNWVHNLNGTLADTGVYAANVVISVFIGAQPPAPNIPHADPDDIARAYWDMYTNRDEREHLITP